MDKIIKTYIVNLKKRKDRHLHIQKQFKNRPEFAIHIVEAIQHDIGAIGLWDTLIYILRNLVPDTEEYILFIEDDHQFTQKYSKKILFEKIQEANHYNADVLSGGVSWFSNILYVNENLFWLEKFSGLQFTVIYKRFFDKIINSDFANNDVADYKISSLTTNSFCIYPFISIQNDFGYSDVTKKNNNEGRVETLYLNSDAKANVLKNIFNYYNLKNISSQSNNIPNKKNAALPTFLIADLDKKLLNNYIREQFDNKNEFEIVDRYFTKSFSNEFNLWLCIKDIIDRSDKKNHEMIVICTSNHIFTENYTSQFFLKNIGQAHAINTDILYFSTKDIKNIVPITQNIFAVNECYSKEFIVIFRRFFKKIKETSFKEKDTVENLLSQIAKNKILLYPFTSEVKFEHESLSYEKMKTINKRLETIQHKTLLYISK